MLVLRKDLDYKKLTPYQRQMIASAPVGEATGNNKLTEVQVLDARQRMDAGEDYKALAKELGVTPGCLYNIKRRLTWKHLP
jgi:hypothetical protein